MDPITLFAFVPTVIILVLGAALFARHRGYTFDLRRRARAVPVTGGRRASDPGPHARR